MATPARALAISVTALLTSAAIMTPTAASASSCVAQSVQAEHELYATAWGRELVAQLASNRVLLQDFGFDSFGDLASYAARQDHTNCPADL